MKFEWFYFVYLMGLKDGLSSGMSLSNEKVLRIVEVERNKALDMIGNADGFWTNIIGRFKDECREKAVEAIKAVAREEMAERQKKFVEEK